MQASVVKDLARQLTEGTLTVDAFVQLLAGDATAQLSGASIDLDRRVRCGFPEVVYAEGKSAETLKEIVATLHEHGEDVLVTRIATEQAAAVTKRFPKARYNVAGRTVRVSSDTGRGKAVWPNQGLVTIVTAGTSDLPVAEEARETAEWAGAEVRMVCDVGVAGPHRLRERLPELEDADAIVVVAGMEGALPSVVGGHVACPIIGVPTSVGYGASFGGLAALLGMLNSCAANVTVVNIDSGFKGGYLAAMIAQRAANRRPAISNSN